MDRSSDKLLSVQIAGLHGIYWMAFCPINSFASIYLLSKGFSNQKIGWVLAIGSVLAIVLQPTLGALADRFSKISLKTLISIMSLISLIMLAALVFLDAGWLVLSILYVGITALLLSIQPLVNALAFEYINAGHNVNFGATRAVGSIGFAILSLFLGGWVTRFSTAILPVICLILFSAFLVLVKTMPRAGKGLPSTPRAESKADQTQLAEKTGFLFRYERFIPFLLGIAFLFVFHTIINTFLAQILISLGGHDTDLGVSLTIAAVCELPAFFGFTFLISRIKNQTLLKLSGFFYAIRSLVFLFAASVWMIKFGQALQGISFAIFIPASVYYINKVMRTEDRVKGQTFVTGTITLGSFFGSVIGGRLLDTSGVPALLTFGAAGAMIGCLLLFYSVRRPKPVIA